MSQNPDARAGAGELLARLSGDRYDGYLDQPIPNGTDDDVRAVVEAYLEADPDTRTALLDHASEEAASILEIFAERQAVDAVRGASPEPIRLGLVALGLAIHGGDYRETLMGLAKLDHSALLPEPARDLIDGFLASDDRDVSLKGMGYAPHGAGPNFNYVNTSPW